MAGLRVRFVDSADKLPRAEWDRLALSCGADLLAWGLVSSFEASGSVVPSAGWQPAHVLIERGPRLAACAPLYIKTHSWGEFIFDFEWAEIASDNGLRWYPKLIGMVPATPVPSWRLLVDPAEDKAELVEVFLDAIGEFARAQGLAGMHILWPDPRARGLLEALDARGWAVWIHQAFLWENRGWADFGAMLGDFSKNMRRNVKRDMAAVAAGGLRTEIIEGRDADTELHRLMGALYLRTNERFGPWAARFLEPAFFQTLAERWPEGMLYSLAREDSGVPIAAALLFKGSDRLYGRYWGTMRDADGLHFELCYYQPIRWAIERGIGSIDPGMGGEHKARRGFRALVSPSFHFPMNERLRRAMRAILPKVNQAEREMIQAINAELPYKG
jgi:predicted N-acyltransferase